MFLKNRIGKRHQTNATGRCPENIVLAELEMWHFCVLPHRCTQDKLDLAFWPVFCVGALVGGNARQPSWKHGEKPNQQNTEAEPGRRRRRGAAHTTKVKKLEIFRKKCPFQCPIFLVYTDRQKNMLFHWFLNVFWGRRHIFWGHFSARHR